MGVLCIVSGPSGSGKTTLCRRMVEEKGGCVYSISCTTRMPREGEIDGRDYNFMTEQEFQERATGGEFLEFARVHGNLYGTLRSTVVDYLKEGVDVLMDIDTRGARLIREAPDPLIQMSFADVFVMPPNLEELRRRLAGRGTESAGQLELRMRNAVEEMHHWHDYAYLILSGDRDDDLDNLHGILTGERLRTSRLRQSPEPGEEGQGDFFAG